MPGAKASGLALPLSGRGRSTLRHTFDPRITCRCTRPLPNPLPEGKGIGGAFVGANASSDSIASSCDSIVGSSDAIAASHDSIAEPAATPGPIGELGTPRDFTVALDANGALTLKWKNTNPTSADGAVYQVYRRIGADAEFAYIVGSGQKKFIDANVPAGSSQVTYQIQAVRSTSVGPWAQFNVNFGTGGSTSVTQGTPVKIAA